MSDEKGLLKSDSSMHERMNTFQVNEFVLNALQEEKDQIEKEKEEFEKEHSLDKKQFEHLMEEGDDGQKRWSTLKVDKMVLSALKGEIEEFDNEKENQESHSPEEKKVDVHSLFAEVEKNPMNTVEVNSLVLNALKENNEIMDKKEKKKRKKEKHKEKKKKKHKEKKKRKHSKNQEPENKDIEIPQPEIMITIEDEDEDDAHEEAIPEESPEEPKFVDDSNPPPTSMEQEKAKEEKEKNILLAEKKGEKNVAEPNEQPSAIKIENPPKIVFTEKEPLIPKEVRGDKMSLNNPPKEKKRLGKEKSGCSLWNVFCLSCCCCGCFGICLKQKNKLTYEKI